MSEPVTTRNGRVMRRAFFSGAYQAELDRQGRVLIPPVLRQFAGLDGQVVVVGTGEGIEIWNAADFDGRARRRRGRVPPDAGVGMMADGEAARSATSR